MKQVIEYKRAQGSGVIKDVDTKKGIVTGYFSIFGNIDSDGDVVIPGAFKKTLRENYRRIKHLYQHDPFKPLSSTKDDRLKLEEDGKGLYFESHISQTSYGRDVIQLYQDGVLDEHSIGFMTIRSNGGGKYREITEVKLFEGSSVTWGANEFALVSDVKSMTLENILDQSDRTFKSLRNGGFETDEVWDMLELHFKQLQKIISERQVDKRATLPRQRNWEALPVFIK